MQIHTSYIRCAVAVQVAKLQRILADERKTHAAALGDEVRSVGSYVEQCLAVHGQIEIAAVTIRSNGCSGRLQLVRISACKLRQKLEAGIEHGL